MKLSSVCLILMTLLHLNGCVSSSNMILPGDDDGVHDPTAPTVQDFETIAQIMARSLITLPQIQNASGPPTIAFLDVENRSNDYIDKSAFLEKIRTILVKNSQGKVVFLDRAKLEDLKIEKEEKEAGGFTSSGKTEFFGADYFLTGVISSISRGQGAKRSVYRRFAFRLTDARSSAIIWEDEYETQILHNRAWRDM